MVEIINSYITDAIDIIELAALLAVGAIVVITWVRTKSVMTTISTMVVGALVLGFIYNAQWFGRRTAEDIQRRDNGMAVLQ